MPSGVKPHVMLHLRQDPDGEAFPEDCVNSFKIGSAGFLA
jgi:hypothetical protein